VLDPGHWIGFILQGSWVITAFFVGAGGAKAVAALFADFIRWGCAHINTRIFLYCFFDFSFQ